MPADSVPASPIPPTTAISPSVAIIGGGIAGLAAAQRLYELDPGIKVTVFEAAGQLGGVLSTVRRDGYLIERSADMFTTREPWALDLCRRVGIEDQLIGVTPANRRAFVVRQGKLLPIPEGFTLMSPAKVWPIIKTPILSPLGKLRLAAEYFSRRRKSDCDESLQSFVVRHFGREAFERLIQPLIGGIYTADPTRLSMQATLPQFVELERKFGSLIRGMRVNRRGHAAQTPGVDAWVNQSTSGARYGLFVTPREGMSSLIDAIAARLPAGTVRLNSRVERIERSDGGRWRLSVAGEPSPQSCDALVLAGPAGLAASLLRDVDDGLAAQIGQISYAGCTVAVAAYRRDRIAHPCNGSGFVVPAIEKRRILAASFSSNKFAGRAPGDRILMRVFVGGALQPELIELPDDDIRRLVREELGEMLGASGEPEFCDVVRWPGMMPQYLVGHLDLVAKIEERAAAIPLFALAGNAYRGVGIPFCIKSGEAAAERIARQWQAGEGREPGAKTFELSCD